MKKPKSVRLGPFVWRIQFDKNFSKVSDSYGGTFSASHLFIIDSSQDRQGQAETLIHEQFHAWWKSSPLYLKYDDDGGQSEGEAIIQILSPFLFQFIRENPEVVAWIQRA